MRLQFHAKRYADDPAEREQTFNSTPADITLPADKEIVIRGNGNIVSIRCGDDEPLVLTLAEWEHTAVALVYDEE